MSVGILLVTHDGVGTPLLAAAQRLLGHLPLRCAVFELPWEADAESSLPAASRVLRQVEGEDGVLILCDLFGATPARLAARLAQLGTPSRRVSGLSLPMLLRTLNYAEQPLDELARTAAAGARNGVMLDEG